MASHFCFTFIYTWLIYSYMYVQIQVNKHHVFAHGNEHCRNMSHEASWDIQHAAETVEYSGNLCLHVLTVWGWPRCSVFVVCNVRPYIR